MGDREYLQGIRQKNQPLFPLLDARARFRIDSEDCVQGGLGVVRQASSSSDGWLVNMQTADNFAGVLQGNQNGTCSKISRTGAHVSLIVIRTARVSSAHALIGGESQQEFSHELSETLMAVAERDQPTTLLRWLETSCYLVVPPDSVHLLVTELRDVRAHVASTIPSRESDEDRLLVDFDKLIEFALEAVASSEYVLMNASVIPTEFALSDASVSL